jgi:hypothetical protein
MDRTGLDRDEESTPEAVVTAAESDATAESTATAVPDGDVDSAGTDASRDESHQAVAQPDASAEALPDRGASAAADETPAADPLREVTVVPGVPRYHNASCILIRFMGDDDLEKMTLAAARDAGCTPCRACLPDEETD